MPVSLLIDKVTDHLLGIDYNKPMNFSNINIHCTLKEFILSGHGLNITILTSTMFELKISADLYSKTLASDYFFSVEKVNNQKKCIDSFSDKNLPLSWLVVTLYYGCFYSAVEMLRLTGSYCSFFTQNDCLEIKEIANNSQNIESGNYSGSVITDSGYIKITFRRSNLGSHELVWLGIKNLMSTIELSKVRARKVSKVTFINDVFKSKIDIDYPNKVRNKWNYSKSDAYSIINDGEYGKFRACLTDLSHAVSLDSSYKKNSKELNEILFIWSVYCFLASALYNLKPRILPS